LILLKKTEIYFYDPNCEHGWLANFSKHSIVVDNVRYRSVEHYFQSEKFLSEAIKIKILNAPSPTIAKETAKSNSKHKRDDWEQIRLGIMYRAIYFKFTQHRELRQKLISSRPHKLIENSQDDDYWGCGNNGKGKNVMGELLMKLRTELTKS